MSGIREEATVLGQQRSFLALSLALTALLLTGAVTTTASAAPRSGSSNCRVVIALYDLPNHYLPSFADQIEKGFGIRIQYRFGATAQTAGIGFAARVSDAQRRALERDPDLERVVPEGAAFVLHSYATTAQTTEWWADVAAKLRFTLEQVIPRFGMAEARLTARQLNRVARLPGYIGVQTGNWVYIVDVQDGVDGIAKASAWAARGYPPRHTFPNWFSLTLPFAEVVALSTDPDIRSVAPNRAFAGIPEQTPPPPAVPARAPPGCR